MTVLGRVLAGALAAGATAAIAGLSQVPWTPEPGPEATVRLSWRARGERVESCRRLSAEELADLPPHMRREEVCEGKTAEYRLRVEVNDKKAVDELVQGSAEVQVRPLYVYRELTLPPGEHTVRVELDRVDSAGADGDDSDEAADGENGRPGHRRSDGRAEATVPRHLRLERRLHLRPREVVLVTYDAERRDLVLRAKPPP